MTTATTRMTSTLDEIERLGVEIVGKLDFAFEHGEHSPVLDAEFAQVGDDHEEAREQPHLAAVTERNLRLQRLDQVLLQFTHAFPVL